MAYGGSPADDVNDEVRFLCGDTSTTAPHLSDDEIEYLVTEYTVPVRAAYQAALASAATLTAKGRISVGTAEKDYGEMARQFKEIADGLAERGGAAGVSNGKAVAPWAGGIVGSTREDGTTVVLETDVDWENHDDGAAASDDTLSAS